MKIQVIRFAIVGCAAVLASFALSEPATGQNAGTDLVPTVSFLPRWAKCFTTNEHTG